MKNILSLTMITLICGLTQAAEEPPLTIHAQGGTGYRINDIRTFEPDETTIYKEDGEIVPDTRAQGGTGYKIRYRISDPNQTITEGTLKEIDLINVLKGPVVSLDPFRVFDMGAVVTGSTYLVNETDIGQFALGDVVQVSGFVDIASNVLMTRIEKNAALTEWKLSGYVQNLTGNSFSLNDQLISYSPADIGNCNGSLSDDDYVEVFATPVVNFQLGDTLNTVTDVLCTDLSVIPPNGGDTVIIEGMIDALVGVDGDFILSGQGIEVDPTTRYIRGQKEDIQVQIKVEVEGAADNVTGVVTADKIRFIEPRINLVIPVEPADMTGTLFNIAGVNIRATGQTLDPDGVLNGLVQTEQVQFRGYDSGNGDLFVTRLNIRGMADYNDIDMEGEITNINQPEIQLFGVRVDTSTSAFFDLNGLPITESEFFNTITLNTKVSVEGGSYDELTEVVSGGDVSIKKLSEAGLFDPQNRGFNPGNDEVLGLGTLSGTPDVIFVGSFD